MSDEIEPTESPTPESAPHDDAHHAVDDGSRSEPVAETSAVDPLHSGTPDAVESPVESPSEPVQGGARSTDNAVRTSTPRGGRSVWTNRISLIVVAIIAGGLAGHYTASKGSATAPVSVTTNPSQPSSRWSRST